jgi:transcriptional regulator of acetoin/glycerol metabolism
VTQCEPHQWVERITARLQGRAVTAPPSLEVLRPAVATALQGYRQDGQLENNPLTRLTLVRARARASVGEEGPSGVAEALRAVLREALDELAQGHGPNLFRHGAEEARVLRLAYVERLGSHERAMERLGLPRTTYYRRLRAGFDHLAATLIAWESLNKRPTG